LVDRLKEVFSSLSLYPKTLFFFSGLCVLCFTTKFVTYYAGMLFLTAMSVDRYIAVVYGTKSNEVRWWFS